MSAKTLTVVSPVNQEPLFEISLLANAEIDAAVEKAAAAFKTWRSVPVTEKQKILYRFCELFEQRKDDVAETIASQMGRPKRYGAGEVKGVLERANYMISVADSSLADEVIEDGPNVRRYLRKEPLGPVFIIAAWNYPYLTMGKPFPVCIL